MLDATDRALIALLRENARIGHAEAARRLRLSRTTVQARVDSLEGAWCRRFSACLSCARFIRSRVSSICWRW
jgi:DNA-binding Lrp family transcriptional regulator